MDIGFGALIGAGFTFGTALVSITTWNVNLQGRVNGHDALFEEREKQLNDRHGELKDRLVRIEQKLDRNYLGGRVRANE